MQPDFQDQLPVSEIENAEASTPDLPPASTRIHSLDVLRGIAVLGGLIISIWLYGGFTQNQQLQVLHQSKGYNYSLFATVSILFEGKMLSLICLVFGAGMVLYLQKKQEANQPAADLFIRRQLWLLGFGLLNALLFLWSGDILFHLAIIGILLFAFVRMSARGLLIAGLVATLVFCGKNYWNYADDKKAYSKYVAVLQVEKEIKKDSAVRAQKDSIAGLQQKAIAQNQIPLLQNEAAGKADMKDTTKAVAVAIKQDTLTKDQVIDKQAWEGIVKGKSFNPKGDEETYANMRQEDFGKIYDHVLPSIQGKEADWTYRTGIWDMSSMMLIGMALFKLGYFNRRWSRNKYLLIAALGIIIGLALAWMRMYVHQLSVADYEKFIQRYPLPYNFLFPFEKICLAIGYSSLVIALIEVAIFKNIWKVLASVGRLALSNYLLQSILCLIFFTGFGMGYFGRLSQYQLYLVVIEIWIVQSVASVLWLRSFSYGPAEWLWRCLVHSKRLPIKEKKNEISAEINPAIL